MYARESIKRYVKTFFLPAMFYAFEGLCFCYLHAMQLSLLDKGWSIHSSTAVNSACSTKLINGIHFSKRNGTDDVKVPPLLLSTDTAYEVEKVTKRLE
jgi:hypothetical protein